MLIATNNSGKVEEYRRLLGSLPGELQQTGLPVELTTPSNEGVAEEPEESGDTFEENALIKARFYSEATGLPALADDSGIEVDALNGEPGVRSARYGGLQAIDDDRNKLLLSRLNNVPWEKRTARFRCVVALVWPGAGEKTFQGVCQGYVAFEPSGQKGFGYDPLFYYPNFGKTFGQIDAEAKDSVSHRSIAARKAAQRLKEVIGAGAPS